MVAMHCEQQYCDMALFRRFGLRPILNQWRNASKEHAIIDAIGDLSLVFLERLRSDATLVTHNVQEGKDFTQEAGAAEHLYVIACKPIHVTFAHIHAC